MEDCDKYELDIKSTMVANFMGMLFWLIIFIYIFSLFAFITGIENANTQLIALIVFMFSVIKILSWVGYPSLQFKPREIKK